jgi:hypothetical protein
MKRWGRGGGLILKLVHRQQPNLGCDLVADERASVGI